MKATLLLLISILCIAAASRPREPSLRNSHGLHPSHIDYNQDTRSSSLPPPWMLPERPWWRRVWPFSSEPLVPVRITPLQQPDGKRASTAEIYLPPSQIHKQGLEPDLLTLGPGSPGSYYTYNSSEMTHVVPTWLAWMTDEENRMNRSRGLDANVAWQTSAYVAATYCDYPNLAAWNCSRCGKEFQPETILYDPVWDLQGFVGFSRKLNAIVIAFRGTDSHSIYNWCVII